MKIYFLLKEPGKTKTSISAIIREKGNRFKLTTGVSVEVRYWEKATHRAKSTKLYPDHETINIQLDRFEAVIKKYFNDCVLLNTKPDLAGLKKEIIDSPVIPSKTNKVQKIEPNNLFLEYFIKYYENADYKPQTAKNYRVTASFIRKFEQYSKQHLTFDDINIQFHNQFKKWMLSTPKPGTEEKPEFYSLNYFGSQIKNIKTVMHESGHEGDALHNNDAYKNRKFTIESEEADTVYLTRAELDQIKDFPINMQTVSANYPDVARKHLQLKINALDRVRNLFLIGCFTALRISDFARLDWNNINDKFIRIKPAKGIKKNEDVVIPIHPVIAAIIASGFDISKKVSHQKINEHIHELCRIVGINEPITTVRTEGGRQVTKTAEKWTLISSHTARRSGATNMFIAGVPSISIMKITSHRTERSFMRYLRISQEENARLMAEHPFFK